MMMTRRQMASRQSLDGLNIKAFRQQKTGVISPLDDFNKLSFITSPGNSSLTVSPIGLSQSSWLIRLTLQSAAARGMVRLVPL